MPVELNSWGRHVSPPILRDGPSTDDNKPYSEMSREKFPWYYGEDAGGYTLTFGKNRGKKVHETSISYLTYCLGFEDPIPAHEPIKLFFAGLEEYAKVACGELIVPFGFTHQGLKIGECDEHWLVWASSQQVLTNKYPVLFSAVKLWLERDHSQEVVQQDSGKVINSTKFNNVSDLAQAGCGAEHSQRPDEREGPDTWVLKQEMGNVKMEFILGPEGDDRYSFAEWVDPVHVQHPQTPVRKSRGSTKEFVEKAEYDSDSTLSDAPSHNTLDGVTSIPRAPSKQKHGTRRSGTIPSLDLSHHAPRLSPETRVTSETGVPSDVFGVKIEPTLTQNIGSKRPRSQSADTLDSEPISPAPKRARAETPE
ncbi:hypothetical protein Hypma_013911 [Hypsizygus marmoreus]|uniref:Uncharacterized protein n=1 Tax=Hypsizygus marmoreus TaxID=39966 RepID=A0A369K9D4_HYPMA|nr:hypothetical protein Hypma_013911 [Hypsizygus marmoreus]